MDVLALKDGLEAVCLDFHARHLSGWRTVGVLVLMGCSHDDDMSGDVVFMFVQLVGADDAEDVVAVVDIGVARRIGHAAVEGLGDGIREGLCLGVVQLLGGGVVADGAALHVVGQIHVAFPDGDAVEEERADGVGEAAGLRVVVREFVGEDGAGLHIAHGLQEEVVAQGVVFHSFEHDVHTNGGRLHVVDVGKQFCQVPTPVQLSHVHDGDNV